MRAACRRIRCRPPSADCSDLRDPGGLDRSGIRLRSASHVRPRYSLFRPVERSVELLVLDVRTELRAQPTEVICVRKRPYARIPPGVDGAEHRTSNGRFSHDHDPSCPLWRGRFGSWAVHPVGRQDVLEDATDLDTDTEVIEDAGIYPVLGHPTRPTRSRRSEKTLQVRKASALGGSRERCFLLMTRRRSRLDPLASADSRPPGRVVFVQRQHAGEDHDDGPEHQEHPIRSSRSEHADRHHEDAEHAEIRDVQVL